MGRARALPGRRGGGHAPHPRRGRPPQGGAQAGRGPAAGGAPRRRPGCRRGPRRGPGRRRGARRPGGGRPPGGRAGQAPLLCGPVRPRGGRGAGPDHPPRRAAVGVRPGLAPPGPGRTIKSRRGHFPRQPKKVAGFPRGMRLPSWRAQRATPWDVTVMTERSVFLAALEYDDPDERSAYLDRACAGEPGLRAQVEQLLTAHEQSGSFMGRPAPERLAGDLAPGPEAGGTRTSPAPGGGEGIDFLDPSDKAGSIGRLGHYEVQEVVGRGGMGVVLRAFAEALHRVVAVKVMAPPLATSATARRRFTREARAAAAVTHDHVVTIHAVEDAGPLPYIVMQFVVGTSLQERLDREGPLQVAEVLRIGMQTAAGLAAAHAQGLIHRDVKPANILLENGVERVKLTDFGLARAAADASLTQSGAVAGTPAFMAPEQAEGKAIDPRTDLFSLGSVLYAMCTGRPPFRAGTSMGVLKRVCEGSPTPIRETNPEVPDWLVDVITKLHAKDPAGRCQSAAEVAELLGRHLAHVQHPSVVPLPIVPKATRETEPPVTAATVGSRPPARLRWATAAAVLVATLAILGTTEATGVTNVRATVIRLFTPDGTLVVETDDPAVKVVVEGDGDLVITGAGPQEVRLRAGSYRLKATRDGKPVQLDRNLVAISRGDRQIVKVSLADGAPATAVVPRAEPGAFVVLSGKGVAEKKFDTLTEAVRNAGNGDTVEVRGNGPFVTEPIVIRGRALTICAG